jgi:hypothetical protein
MKKNKQKPFSVDFAAGGLKTRAKKIDSFFNVASKQANLAVV